MATLAVQGNRSTTMTPAADRVFFPIPRELLRTSGLRAVFYFAWNAQSVAGRWLRLVGLTVLAPIAVAVSVFSRVSGHRLMHLLLRGFSNDRLEFLSQEYFDEVLKTRLGRAGAVKIRRQLRRHPDLVLQSHMMDHLVRALARHFGMRWVFANRMDVRDQIVTGRLSQPVIPPIGIFARFGTGRGNRTFSAAELSARLHCRADDLLRAVQPASHFVPRKSKPIMNFGAAPKLERLSVRDSLRGKHVLLAGGTGFIGKVWVAHALQELPDLGRLYVLIRRNRSRSALERFERMVAESPVFQGFHERFGDGLGSYVAERVEIIEGDVCQPGLGIAPEIAERLKHDLDLFINSTGLTDFTPDLRDALSMNVDATINVLDFLHECDRAALMHLSTCFVAGDRNGRIPETFTPNYTPRPNKDFDAERLRLALHQRIQLVETQSESAEMTERFRRVSQEKSPTDRPLSEAALDKQVYKQRFRWTRDRLVERGKRMAKKLGWPNTYCMSKSMAESQLAMRGGDLAIAVVRPAIVESATRFPFAGWNEGINTTAPLAYTVGTFFRQLPSSKTKILDVIAVDSVCRGMSLVAAALVERKHHRVYHLASSGSNPCDMRRAIELNGLAHRRHLRAEGRLRDRILARMDTIPVSKLRYQAFSAPTQRAVLRSLQRVISAAHLNSRPIAKVEKGLSNLQKLVALYEPFILHNDPVFETENIRALSRALVAEECDAFGYDVETLDWWDYWINVHIPGLRRWVFPLIEGRTPELPPAHSFRMSSPVADGREAGPTNFSGNGRELLEQDHS